MQQIKQNNHLDTPEEQKTIFFEEFKLKIGIPAHADTLSHHLKLPWIIFINYFNHIYSFYLLDLHRLLKFTNKH